MHRERKRSASYSVQGEGKGIHHIVHVRRGKKHVILDVLEEIGIYHTAYMGRGW